MKIEVKGDVGMSQTNPKARLQVAKPEKNIIFGATSPGGEGEMIRLEEGKFFWKGEEVKDTKKIYERFCEWMHWAENN